MPSRDPDRPNILSILADDHGFWALGCAGNDEIQTPNLDRLAGEGLRLENLFCASPVCSPARASLLTGRIPSQHGVHDFLSGGNTLKRIEPAGKGRLIQYLDHCPAYTEVLAEAGYACGLSGKWHLGDCHHAQKGFSFWKVHVRGGGPYYGAPMAAGDDMIEAPEYVTDLFTRNALAFLDTQADSDAPFHLGVHYTAPHSPWSRKNHPHETWDRYFEDCPFASVPDLPVHPCQVRYLINPDRSNRRELLAGYYTAVTEMDRCIGELLDRLEAMGIAENTLVLFTSDNGMSMGHHGIYEIGRASCRERV
jgi:choline-sulfatase